MTSPLHFPSQELIVDYIKHHPLTKDLMEDLDQIENRVIEIVAAHFANQDKEYRDFNSDLAHGLLHLGDRFNWSTPAFATIHISLCQVLINCAEGATLPSGCY